MTTYVLGAGASVHAGFPLCYELWQGLKDWARLRRGIPSEVRKTLAYVEKRCGRVKDLEDVLTRLSQGEEPFKHLREEGRRESKLINIRHALGSHFREIHSRGFDAGLYEALSKTVRRGDVFLTFNYDVALEIELNRAGKFRVKNGYGFELDWNEPRSRVRVLKPHGSINWFGLKGLRGYSGGSPEKFRSLGPHPLVDNTTALLPGYPCRVLQNSVRDAPWREDASIILPTRAKEYRVTTEYSRSEWEEFFESLWLQAETALSNSSRIVMIGYSMPKADPRPRHTILKQKNTSAEVFICCGEDNRRLVNDFRKSGFPRVQERGRFAEYLGSI